MKQIAPRRIIRLVLGGSVILIPLLALIHLQLAPAAPNLVQPAYAANPLAPNSTEETQTAVAATATFTASLTSVAKTQTAIPGTQTAVAGTQTAVAATQTAEALPTSTAQYIDVFEPNNSLETAYTTAKGTALANLTLWPLGDVDYFRFLGHAGSMYQVFTRDLVGDLDTVLTAFDTNGNVLQSNDDYLVDKRDSKVSFFTGVEGYYFVKVENKAPTDPANKTYILEVQEIDPPTATATVTPVPADDRCDTATAHNDSFDTACLIIANDPPEQFDFVPRDQWGQDNDFFRVWVRAGSFYSCQTSDLSALNDTNIIIYDQNLVGLAGNNDRAPGDVSSAIGYQATYTGWLYLLIGPVYPPEYALSPLYTYSLDCTGAFVTLTPVPTVTPTPVPFVNPPPATVTFTPVPTLSPPPVPVVTTQTPEPPTPRPIVQILPLPTATVPAQAPQSLSLNVTIYYDANANFTPELTEGIMDVAVALYDNASNQLLAFGYTNEAGMIHFGPVALAGAARIEVPFLGYSQVVVGNEPDIQVRVAPAVLPGNIP